MIKGNLMNYGEDRKYLQAIDNALNFLQNTDLKALPLGRTQISDTMYAQVLEYETEPSINFQFETHKNRIDLHYLVRGTEAFILEPTENFTGSTDYNEERDMLLFEDALEGKEVILNEGEYLFINQNEAHKTNGAVGNQSSNVRKIVIKIEVIK